VLEQLAEKTGLPVENETEDKYLNGTMEKVPIEQTDEGLIIDGKLFLHGDNGFFKKNMVVVKNGETTNENCEDCAFRYITNDGSSDKFIGSFNCADYVGNAEQDCAIPIEEIANRHPRMGINKCLCPHDEVYRIKTYDNLRGLLDLPSNIVERAGFAKKDLIRMLENEEKHTEFLDAKELQVKPQLEKYLNKINAKADAIKNYLMITK